MLSPKLLRDRHYLVTGGGSGLGAAMTRRLLELGARVTIAARKADRLEKAAKDLGEETGGTVLAVPTDIREHEQCAALVERATKEQGPLDGLVNNAAGNFLSAAEDLSPGGFDAVVDIVLKGTWHVTQAVGRSWIETQRAGAVVSILTTYVHTGSAFVLPSAMAKAGLLAMTRSLAVEWGSAYGIRLNAIAPGPFPTEGAWDRLAFDRQAAETEVKERIPLHRFGEPSELAELAAFLLAPGSGYINGACIDIDGGGWLAGGGEFSAMTRVDRGQLKQIFAAMRPKKS